ncbi:hypothetical protein EMIHUDRAFT_221606 [Emiliania huxleyi CCMP1516]|uniref:SAM domain-containing protein n=2 Tax=Emiliania huxleyi TaxID=2903 RepID=A0A0D3HXW2_EMIH1|nr:hypothetical protein EMIHUDRAFT_221606 [Emiliania huxleyi CCMP1516]EOD03847.1 hypothetical protein EMIHUDRAFT_221606 [Emiliania huxleyi CCMP1516]|eukprot:XP_005756276.1 hypothetical protein EMIHUDRAFT_221606 [Emiliania huxleyi CCMP1516]
MSWKRGRLGEGREPRKVKNWSVDDVCAFLSSVRLEAHAPRFAAEQVDGLLLEECVAACALAQLGIDDSLEVAKLRAGLRRCSQNSLTTSPALAAATLGGEAAQGEAAADVGGGGGAGGYESPVDEASEGLGTPPAPMVHPSGTLGVSVGGSTGGEVEAAAAAAAMDDDDEEGAAVLDEAAAKVACREVIQHTNPFGSATASTRLSRPPLTAPLQGWLARANPRSGIALRDFGLCRPPSASSDVFTLLVFLFIVYANWRGGGAAAFPRGARGLPSQRKKAPLEWASAAAACGRVMERAYWHLPEPSLGGNATEYLPDGSWGGWEEFIDGVLCEVVYALDKQLRWIEKNIQPGTKRVQARLRAQDLAMKNGDNQRVVEARPAGTMLVHVKSQSRKSGLQQQSNLAGSTFIPQLQPLKF